MARQKTLRNREPRGWDVVDAIPPGTSNSPAWPRFKPEEPNGSGTDDEARTREYELVNAELNARTPSEAEVSEEFEKENALEEEDLDDDSDWEARFRRYLLTDQAPFTDAANALRLSELEGNHIRFVPKWRSWLVWDGYCWQRDDASVRVGELAKRVGLLLLDEAGKQSNEKWATALAKWGINSLSASRIRAMIELARGIEGLMVEPDELDRDPWLFGVRNGVVNLRTGQLQAASPRDLMSMQAPVEWDTQATTPRWDKALTEWFPDPSVRSYVQRLVGAALVGKQRDHLFVVHYGSGANGKGTFMRALFTMLGPYAVVPHLSLLVNTKYEQHATVKATLYRTRLAVAAETQRRVHLNEASIKNLTGDDPISCRRLYENEWTFQPSHMLWLQTNYLPEITGRDHGIWRRIRVVPWTATFEREHDEDIDGVLKAEASGILVWAVKGCIEWQRIGLAEPEAVLRRTAEYQEDQDVFTRFMADAGLIVAPKLEIAIEELNKTYDEWAESQGTDVPYKDFAGWLKAQGCERKRRRVPTYSGAAKSVQKWYYGGVGASDGNWDGVPA